MNIPTMTNLVVLWCAVIAVAVGFGWVALRLVRDNRRLRRELESTKRAFRTTRAEAVEDRRVVRGSNQAWKKRFVRLDKKLLSIETRQQRLEQHTGGSRPYELAMQMAGRGAGVEDLIAAGLSRGEAELALHMHGLAVS